MSTTNVQQCVIKHVGACQQLCMQLTPFPHLHICVRVNVSLGVTGVQTFLADKKKKKKENEIVIQRFSISVGLTGCRMELSSLLQLLGQQAAVCCQLTASLRNLLLELETLTPVCLTDSVHDTHNMQRRLTALCHS